MIRIILHDLWQDFKKSFLYFLCCFVVYFLLSTLGITMALTQFITDVQISGQNYTDDMLSTILNAPTANLYVTAMNSLAALLLLFLILKRLPIRLAKPLYFCAVGRTEKLHYLRLYLLVKLGFSLVFTILIQLYMTGTFLISANWQQNVVQIGLWFFLLLALNLRIDPGNRKEILEVMPTIDTEKSVEVMVNIYWFIFLLVQNLVFYTLSIIQPTWNIWIFLVWIVVFVLNGLIAKRCISPVLAYMLSYERLYYPLPDIKE